MHREGKERNLQRAAVAEENAVQEGARLARVDIDLVIEPARLRVGFSSGKWTNLVQRPNFFCATCAAGSRRIVKC